MVAIKNKLYRLVFIKINLKYGEKMKITLTDNLDNLKDNIILFTDSTKKLSVDAKKIDKLAKSKISKKLSDKDFSAKLLEKISLSSPFDKCENAAIYSIGKKSSYTICKAWKIGSNIFNYLNTHKIKNATIIAGGTFCVDSVSLMIESLVLKNYNFDKYRTKNKDKDKIYIENITIYHDDIKSLKDRLKEIESVSEGVKYTRDLVSEPSNILTPTEYSKRIKKDLTKLKVKVKILGEKEMKAQKMNALLGVGQGSSNESQLVIMEYNGLGKNDKKSRPLGFVGKGVTFDTGGISIKPAANMWDMKYDMGGSAVVVGLIKALAARKAKVHVVGVVGLVENMPDGNAQRPGDIVSSMSGQTIEVLNTDAEGRLVLADALTYIQKHHKPELIVDLATLTGAIVVALANQYAGLFSNNDKLSENLTKAGLESDEKIWRFPLSKEYDEMIDSPVADMQNISNGKGAGSITAAQFLKRFIEKDTAWAHLDIAGVTWADKPNNLCPKGATGFGVRLLNKFVKDNYEK